MKKTTILLFVSFIISINISAQSPVLSDPKVEKIATGFNFIEGPVWVEDLGLLFSDIPENKVYLFDQDSLVSEYINPSGKSNGLALLKNELVLCQHLDRQVGKYEGENILSIATHYDGKKLNSPNDLAIKSNGSIFFTDPPFGLNDEGGTSELGYAGIFCLSATGKVYLLDKTLSLPNGIAFSPDETKLYVIDSEIADIYVWDVINDSTLTNKTLFYDMNTQWGDGMKTDSLGFLYVAAANGLTIFSAQGDLIENIYIGPKNASNCNWGSINNNTEMYVTAGNSLYRLRNKSQETGLNSTPFQNQNNPILIYPNPSTGEVSIDIQNMDTKKILFSIYTADGKLIESIETGKQGPYQWKAINDGLYIAKVQIENKTYTKEFIINNNK